MKKTAVIALTFALIACLFTGCRRNVTPETSAPTTEPTRPATHPTTAATTPTTAHTTPTATSGTEGTVEDSMTGSTGETSRSRRPSRMP